jgi:LPXTG-site transpeptidase (sortase) family protein
MIVITGLVLVRWVGFETGVFSSKQAAIAPAFALPVPKLEPLVATPVSAATPATPAGATTADARSHLSISKLGINAPIQQVGLTPDGNMDVPSNLQTLGWYNGGPKPGEPGNAVIAGHYGAPKVAGIFRTLDRLAIGDIIEVVDGSRTLKFRVKEVAQYPLANVPLQKLFGASATAHLNLVTCVGAFDGAKYSDRLVVYTDLMR